jgi:hypothetical protein
MTDVHQAIRENLNKIISDYSRSPDSIATSKPVTLVIYRNPGEEWGGQSEVGLEIATNLHVSLFLDDEDDWIFWVYKTKKDGDPSKTFKETMVSLDIPDDKKDNPAAVLNEFMKAIIGVEHHENCKNLLQYSPKFHNLYKPAMLLALQKVEMTAKQPVTQKVVAVEEKKAGMSSDNKFGLVILAIFIFMLLVLSNSNSNGSAGCSFVPDPRGGYSDC